MGIIVPGSHDWHGSPDKIVGGGDGPHNPSMEHRVTALETRLDTILPTLATRADVAEAKSSIIMWGTTAGIGLAAVIITVLVFAINRAATPAAPAAQPQPIVIQIPPPTLAAPAPQPSK